jgi:endonuclease YncB( thermonuclease family)
MINRLKAPFLGAIFALVASAASAQQQWPVPVEVVDGDTVRWQGRLVRIVGMDAPEMRGRCPRERERAAAATTRMQEIAIAGVIIEPVSRRDKYGRLLAVVRNWQGRDVAEIMIAEGLAAPYNGRGRRGDWCAPGS